MPATVINGLFSMDAVAFIGGDIVGRVVSTLVPVPNTQSTTITLNSGAISPLGSAFSVVGGQLPVTLNPGQTALIAVQYIIPDFIPRVATLTITTSIGAYTPVVSLVAQLAGFAIAQVKPGASLVIGGTLIFPPTKIGLSASFLNFQIQNPSSVNTTVTAVSIVTGTDFFALGAPITPFVLTPGQSSAVFTVQFIPSVAGSRNDKLKVTSTDGVNIVSEFVLLTGMGTTLQSAFSLTGATQGALFAFPGGGGNLIMIADPNNLNCEDVSSFTRLHDFQVPNYEKKLMRIRGHYEDLGPAIITFTARGRRQGKPDEVIAVSVAIGTGAADSWPREFTSEPVPITAEIVQISMSRTGLSGPVSLIDYMPEFELGGQVIGGT